MPPPDTLLFCSLLLGRRETHIYRQHEARILFPICNFMCACQRFHVWRVVLLTVFVAFHLTFACNEGEHDDGSEEDQNSDSKTCQR